MPIHAILGLESLSPPRTGIGRYTAALLREYLAMPERVRISGYATEPGSIKPLSLPVLSANLRQCKTGEAPSGAAL